MRVIRETLDEVCGDIDEKLIELPDLLSEIECGPTSYWLPSTLKGSRQAANLFEYFVCPPSIPAPDFDASYPAADRSGRARRPQLGDAERLLTARRGADRHGPS